MAKELLEQSQAARDDDQKKLDELERLKHDMEERIQGLRDHAELLERANASLAENQRALEDRSNTLLENFVKLEDASDVLRKENDILLEQVRTFQLVSTPSIFYALFASCIKVFSAKSKRHLADECSWEVWKPRIVKSVSRR